MPHNMCVNQVSRDGIESHCVTNTCRESASIALQQSLDKDIVRFHTDMHAHKPLSERVSALQRGLDDLAQFTPDVRSTAMEILIPGDMWGNDHVELRTVCAWERVDFVLFHWWWATLLQRIICTTTRYETNDGCGKYLETILARSKWTLDVRCCGTECA
jgi:hypothetical protein